jgi:hypothetical protein
MWSLRALTGMVRARELNMGQDDHLHAKWILDRSLDAISHMETWNNDPVDMAVSKAPFGVDLSPQHFDGDPPAGVTNGKGQGMAKFIAELAVAIELGVADSPSLEPTNLWTWGHYGTNLDISTSTYGGTSLPWAPAVDEWNADAVQSPGDGLSRLVTPYNEILTSLGGYGLESFSLQVTINGVPEIDTGAIDAGRPASQRVWRDGVEIVRTQYDTSVIPHHFANSIKSIVTRKGSNYETEVTTEFFQSTITQAYKVRRFGKSGLGKVVHSFPARKNVLVDFVNPLGAKITVWDGLTIIEAPPFAPETCKYIHMKWPKFKTGIILIPIDASVGWGAKVNVLRHSPQQFARRQPDQDRSLLIYLANGTENMGDVSVSYEVRFTNGTDGSAEAKYARR